MLVRYFSHPTLGDATTEFIELINDYAKPGGITDSKRLDDCVRLENYLWRVAEGDLDAYVARTHPTWVYQGNIPVYWTTSVPYAIFTITLDTVADSNDLIVLALHFGFVSGIPFADQKKTLWETVSKPRLDALA
ncbi:MAG TPA: hypothetical protein DC046_07700 [Rhodospirillaceae bacterium]|nr:hypothetical protein [Rhodospirillaceae bacterium]|tara:strand:+ start:225 stop:626 length:402 start_codon:yes stop_codon:yes gene_type:complete